MTTNPCCINIVQSAVLAMGVGVTPPFPTSVRVPRMPLSIIPICYIYRKSTTIIFATKFPDTGLWKYT
jgi:hypothetical protein